MNKKVLSLAKKKERKILEISLDENTRKLIDWEEFKKESKIRNPKNIKKIEKWINTEKGSEWVKNVKETKDIFKK